MRAVDEVNLRLNEGDTLGIAGESACGKTVLALSIMRLIPRPPGRIVSGRILFEGGDLLSLSDEEMRRVRGKRHLHDLSPGAHDIPQLPSSASGDQVAEVFPLQELSQQRAVRRDAPGDALASWGSRRRRCGPGSLSHQMSGGMRRGVDGSMALSCRPRLMLADELTTALDVTIQARSSIYPGPEAGGRDVAVVPIEHMTLASLPRQPSMLPSCTRGRVV